MVEIMHLISSKLYDFIIDNSKILSIFTIFLVTYCYFLGIHTTLLRDVVFVISFAVCVISIKTYGRREMAEYIIDHKEVLDD